MLFGVCSPCRAGEMKEYKGKQEMNTMFWGDDVLASVVAGQWAPREKRPSGGGGRPSGPPAQRPRMTPAASAPATASTAAASPEVMELLRTIVLKLQNIEAANELIVTGMVANCKDTPMEHAPAVPSAAPAAPKRRPIKPAAAAPSGEEGF